MQKRQKWSELQVIVAEKRRKRDYTRVEIGGFLAAGETARGHMNGNKAAIRGLPLTEKRYSYMAILTKNIMT